jgi:hypothetical protein
MRDPWKPGQSGSPKGRPPGSRNNLGEAFVEALYKDFVEHGAKAIVACRETKPEVYLMVSRAGRHAAFIKLWEVISSGTPYAGRPPLAVS